MVEDRFLKRLRKKGRKGLRGWPIATVAFYGPNLSQATKVAVGIVPSENAEVEELRDWKVDRGDIRSDPDIAREMREFIEEHRVKSVAITDGIIGCPHQEGIDCDGEWCPVCEFWHGRDRFTGQFPKPNTNPFRGVGMHKSRLVTWVADTAGAPRKTDKMQMPKCLRMLFCTLT